MKLQPNDIFFVTFLTLFYLMALFNTAYNYEERSCEAIAPPEAVWAVPKTQEEQQLLITPMEKI